MSDWLLFVDESGNFNEPCDRVLVAGLLLRVGSTWADLSSDRIAQQLREAMPGMPWPLHAAHQNIPATFAVARYEQLCQEGRIHMELGPFDATVREAGEFFHDDPECGDLFLDARDSFANGGLPERETLKSLDRQLKKKRFYVHQHLQDLSRDATADVLPLLRGLEPLNEKLTDAAVIVASEANRQPTGNEQKWRYKSRRWVALLEGVLERSFDLLSQIGGGHRVVLRVAALNVYIPEVYPRSRARPLDQNHLNWILRNVHSRGCERWNTVAGIVDSDPIHYFAPGTPGPLVLADFIANHVCARLNAKKTLMELQAILHVTCGLDSLIQSGNPSLSHLAATGWPQDAINAARCSNERPARPPGQLATWATEQADVWVRVLRGVV
jgi:hypothetical protein